MHPWLNIILRPVFSLPKPAQVTSSSVVLFNIGPVTPNRINGLFDSVTKPRQSPMLQATLLVTRECDISRGRFALGRDCNFNSNLCFSKRNHGILYDSFRWKCHPLTPVTMKVFAWTRSFVLQKEVVSWDPGSAAADVLFCSNGFEQHWGQCKRQFLDPKEFQSGWKSEVLKAANLSP